MVILSGDDLRPLEEFLLKLFVFLVNVLYILLQLDVFPEEILNYFYFGQFPETIALSFPDGDDFFGLLPFNLQIT